MGFSNFANSSIKGPVTGIPKATVTATTGSPTIDAVSRAGKTIYIFNSSGSITVDTGGTAEILLVGGGGAGGSNNGGGGGGGGHLYSASEFLPSGTLTVTVGAGGTGASPPATIEEMSGKPSRLGNIFAYGGGFGGLNNSAGLPGSLGGSGGGSIPSNGYTNANVTGASGITGQGNKGGDYTYGAAQSGAGGGGAGAVGGNANPSSSTGGTGGAGTATSITGTSVTRAGGGGGYGSNAGSGGAGGGGAGASSGAATSGSTNTGGGGGGTNNAAGGSGGSGVVIVVIG
jgi:hypothetical protein